MTIVLFFVAGAMSAAVPYRGLTSENAGLAPFTVWLPHADKPLWTMDVGSQTLNAPVLMNDGKVVAIAVADGAGYHLWIVDAASGKVVFTIKLNWGCCVELLAVDNGIIYTRFQGDLRTFSLEDGRPLWTVPYPPSPMDLRTVTRPNGTSLTLVRFSEDRVLTVNGSVNHGRSFNSVYEGDYFCRGFLGYIAATLNGSEIEFVAAGGCALLFTDAAEKPRWETRVSVSTTNAMLAADRVFLHGGGQLMALNRTTGKVQWEHDCCYFGPYAVSPRGERLYGTIASNTPATMYAINATTGVVVWNSSLALAVNDLIYADQADHVFGIFAGANRRPAKVCWLKGLTGELGGCHDLPVGCQGQGTNSFTMSIVPGDEAIYVACDHPIGLVALV